MTSDVDRFRLLHTMLRVTDLDATFAFYTNDPGAMKHGGCPIAFIEDPDGYKIELVERA